jgi:hypothetical protein
MMNVKLAAFMCADLAAIFGDKGESGRLFNIGHESDKLFVDTMMEGKITDKFAAPDRNIGKLSFS